MQTKGYLDRFKWEIGAQLAIVDLQPSTNAIAIELPNGQPAHADIVSYGSALVLNVEGGQWTLRSIPSAKATMPIKTTLPITYWEAQAAS